MHTSTVLTQTFSSLLGESLKGSCHSWMCSWPGKTMVASVLVFCKPTHTHQYLANTVTQQPIRRQLLGHWCAGQGHFPPQVWSGLRRKSAYSSRSKRMGTLSLSSQGTVSHSQSHGMRSRRASVTIPYIHGLSQSIRIVLSSLAIKVTFSPYGLWSSALGKLCPREACRGKGWCTASPVASAHGHTSGRQAWHWIIAWQNTDGLSGTGMCQLQQLLNTCLLLGTRWISRKPRY